ncbi:Undefined function [Listeria monocytogenes N53-1]|nr:Undefined function [Listeria monocytogenes]CCQ22744.1 Undefined function [Listeria monocytogenes N53-1]
MDEKEKNLNENSEKESTPKREVEETLHTRARNQSKKLLL